MKGQVGVGVWFCIITATLCIGGCVTCGIAHRLLPYRERQSDFDLWTDERPFDREAWINKTTTDDCAYPGVHYLRGMMIDDMERRFRVSQMRQSQIKALLGPPDGHRQLKDGFGLWEYELGVWDHHEGNYLTFVFNGDRVQATNGNERFEEE